MRASVAAALLASGAALPVAHAQTDRWPERPVRVVVPFAPGGATDIVARLIGPRMSEEFGQAFVVDNRAGAGGSIGVEIVVRANPDGHTILVGASSYSSNAALYKLSFDPLKDIAPVTLITRGIFIMTVHPSVKATNIKELIALARAKPNSISFGSSGVGGVPHLATELFKQMTGVQMLHVPFKGDGPAVPALLAGEIQLYAGGPIVVGPHIAAGKLRPLAVTSAQRSPALPDLPAVSETVPGYEGLTWFGLWVPKGTSKAIVSRLNQAVGRALKHPQVLTRLKENGMEPGYGTPEEFQTFVAGEIAKWTKVVKAGNIRVE
ncbi:MAG TPA: tripartite tricarboxylate transporter substrate binding protein [Burkholderiales bacterium]|nr:tripartite tricarboxylate transporter substrate binding protein [Burkholderiales bacterium]